jgi:hypothetical protein
MSSPRLGFRHASLTLLLCLLLAGCATTPPVTDTTTTKPKLNDLATQFSQEFEAAVTEGTQQAFISLMHRAFAKPGMTRKVMLATLETKVGHPQLWVRVEVIEWLYRQKEFSGRDELIRIAALPQPAWYPETFMGGIPWDVRERAALVMGRNGDALGADSLRRAYGRTPSYNLLDAMVHLRLPEAIGALRAVSKDGTGETMGNYSLSWYGFVGTPEDLPYLRAELQAKATTAYRRLDAAWAITRIKVDAEAAAFVRNEAQAAFRKLPPGKVDPQAALAVRYLGTLTDPESVRLLEKIALEASVGFYRLTALCNLAYHHRDRSPVGRASLTLASNLNYQQNIKGMNVLLAYKIATLSPEDAYAPEIRRGLLIRRSAIPWHVAGETPPLSSYVVDAPRSERMSPYIRTNSDRD